MAGSKKDRSMPAPAQNSRLCLPHGIADLGDIFLRVLRFMGTDVIDVEHGAVKGVAVVSNPCRNRGINIKDESLGIDWRIPVEKAILSEKDLKHACLKDAVLDFDINDKLY